MNDVIKTQNANAAEEQNLSDQYQQKKTCRICHRTELKQYLDLGSLPLVNSYVHPDGADNVDPIYPLVVNYCPNCSMSQLSIVVEPSVMFSNYFYRSSVSKTFTQHCYAFAEKVLTQFSVAEGELVVDIGSNDGACLREFKKFGVDVLGVEPAQNLAELSRQSGVMAENRFWNAETAEYLASKYRPAKLITAMNVFAHTDDLDSFLSGINTLLADDGVFIIECPYNVNLIQKTEFDTIYHEHLSYFLLKPLIYLMQRHNLEVFDAELFAIHGGTIRVFTRKKTSQLSATGENKDNLNKLLQLEKTAGLYELSTYLDFADNVNKIRADFTSLIAELKSQGKKIAAYGASAKGNILLNFCNMNRDKIAYIVDDTPEKQGYLAPGQHLPIVPATALTENKPDYLVITAWNFAAEIMEKTQAFSNTGGKYIIPIPEVKVI